MKAIELNITEMNAAGSISLEKLSGINSTFFTNWKVPEKDDPKGLNLT